MKKQAWFGVLVAALVSLVAGVPAHAQDMGKFSVFGGYSYQINGFGQAALGGSELCILGGICGGQGLHGYTGSVVYNVNNHLGIEANFSGHNGSTTLFRVVPTIDTNGEEFDQRQDFYTYTFGPKVSFPVGNFSLFTHFLVGGAHGHAGLTAKCLQAEFDSECDSPETGSSRGNGFAFKVGGGADWNHGHWGIRILEVDYVRSSIFATTTSDQGGCGIILITCGGNALQSHVGSNNFELSTGFTFNFGGMQ